MKIMILSAATGGGHLRAANALETYINTNTGYSAQTFDTFKCISSVLDKTVCDGYLFLAKKTPSFFGKLYASTNKDTPFANMVPKFSGLFARELLPTITAYEPDIIISTHPFSTEMISYLKEIGKVRVPLICLMTDYGVHRAWICENVDAYVVASEDMVYELKTFGVEEKKIYPFGIPVFNVFFEKQDKEMLLREMHMEEDVPTILLMAGSFGVSNIIQLYRKLVAFGRPLQLIVITGRNKKLYDAFEEEIQGSPIKTKLVYFTTEVEKYMHISDLIVTKPGGLTVSEALACNLPLAVFDAIPGQEEDNANFLKVHDMGVRIDKNTDFGEFISNLLEEKDKLKRMRESCEKFDKSQSSANIISLVKKLTEENPARV